MIRVIYRWQIVPGTESEFSAWWQTQTALEAFWNSSRSRTNPYGDLVAVEILAENCDAEVRERFIVALAERCG